MRIIVQYLIASAIFLLIYWLLPIFKPFLAGAFFAAVLHRPAHFIQRKTNASRTVAVCVSMVWILLLLSAGCLLFAWISARTVSHLHTVIPHYIPIAVMHLEQLLQSMMNFLTKDQLALLLQYLHTVETAAAHTVEESAGKWLLAGTFYFLSLPGTATQLLIALLAAFFMAKDGSFFLSLLPESIRAKTARAANTFSFSLYAYGYAQLKLFTVTFTAACAGFFLLGTPHILELAFLTAVLEFIPIVGSILLFVPWIFFCLLTGQTHAAIFTAVLYTTLVLVRQLLEPKLVSDSAGLHPLAVLFAAFAGYHLTGVFGLITAPLFLLLGLSIHQAGLFFTKR
ncbi:AI-2E family transporter [Domibacillus indicus]|uniref:AI-2E family transporter n=1 Tax=Domibacillus TaxID=1433999 RepID=UPI00203D93B8|nr:MULTISPECIES: AI-2E family transporter [Domibacillus]MCM3786956.1 AI-2E family transporter [Domibacillus indicus]WNS81742.1 AI-2E family transporter [Domibacillus sp. DTU_2020_1001157_1_SI_ALB_TIR_016]